MNSRWNSAAWFGQSALAACAVAIVLANVAAGQSLRIVETDQRIVVLRGERSVLTYNKVSPPAPAGIDPIYERSGCLHPVMSPSGRTVTAMFPADHPHQNGVFTAWVKTTYDKHKIDFWNLAARTGRVLHERVVSKTERDGDVAFEVDLLHRQVGNRPVDILREHWKITVYATEPTYNCFDLALTQTALTDKPLIVHEYHYGGVAVRGPVRWLSGGGRKQAGELREPFGMLNDLGSDRVKGNHEHAKWVAMTGLINGRPATIVVLSHPDNFRAPQAARLHPTKPYFCFAPSVDGEFRIDRGHPYRARYRFLVTDAKPDAAWIARQWQSWTSD